MPRYPNGQIPDHELIIFNRGTTTHRLADGRVIVENWYQGLTPGTYRKHLALVSLAKKNTGGNLQLAAGFSCYRPIYGQEIARILYGNGAAGVSTSSHGGWWESRETMATDYANWSAVYGGDRSRFYADCRAVGLSPGLISKARGYPDEPWHVIDLDPWAAVPAGVGAEPFEPLEEFMGALSDDQQRQMYDALVVNGGQYYMPQAIVNEIRGEEIPRLNGIVARTDATNTTLGAIIEMLKTLDPSKSADIAAFEVKLRESEARTIAATEQAIKESTVALRAELVTGLSRIESFDTEAVTAAVDKALDRIFVRAV